jgi:hypothetical protein
MGRQAAGHHAARIRTAVLGCQIIMAHVTANLERLADMLLAPRTIERDAQGFVSHPALPLFDESVDLKQFLFAFGIESALISMEFDCGDQALIDRYYDGGSDCAAFWKPNPPKGDGWVLLDIFDTEDTPHALFARKQTAHTTAAPTAASAQQADGATTDEPVVRYCPGCGSMGPVEAKYRDCCPDGDEARAIPTALPEKCSLTFKVALKSMLADSAANAPSAQPAQQSEPAPIGEVFELREIIAALLLEIEDGGITAATEKAAYTALHTPFTFSQAAPVDADPIRQLVAAHAEFIEAGNDYAYFELAYTSRTEWMAWLCTNARELDSDRRVIAQGQGDTPEDACRAALAASKQGEGK